MAVRMANDLARRVEGGVPIAVERDATTGFLLPRLPSS